MPEFIQHLWLQGICTTITWKKHEIYGQKVVIAAKSQTSPRVSLA